MSRRTSSLISVLIGLRPSSGCVLWGASDDNALSSSKCPFVVTDSVLFEFTSTSSIIPESNDFDLSRDTTPYSSVDGRHLTISSARLNSCRGTSGLFEHDDESVPLSPECSPRLRWLAARTPDTDNGGGGGHSPYDLLRTRVQKKRRKGLFLDIRRRKASSTFLLKKGCFFPLYRHLGVLFRKA